jgi:hypothetical protein
MIIVALGKKSQNIDIKSSEQKMAIPTAREELTVVGLQSSELGKSQKICTDKIVA